MTIKEGQQTSKRKKQKNKSRANHMQKTEHGLGNSKAKDRQRKVKRQEKYQEKRVYRLKAANWAERNVYSRHK